MIYIITSLLFLSASLGAIGPVILWSRFSQMGDALAHSVTFSLVLSYLFGFHPLFSSILIAILFVIFLELSEGNTSRNGVSSDNGAKIVAFSSLLISLTILSSDLTDGRIRIKEFFVGDALAITQGGLYSSIALFIVIFSTIIFSYKTMILTIMSPEIAKIKGVRVRLVRLMMRLVMSIVIAISASIVGILLVSSILVIPALISRLIATSPKSMILLSSAISLVSCICALVLSFTLDLTYGPCQALVLSSSYIGLLSYKRFFGR